MAFLIPSIQFLFGLPCALFCFGIHFNVILGNLKVVLTDIKYRSADKSLAQPGRKQARKHVRDARDFNNIEARAVIKLFLLQGKAPKEIHVILTETLACFLPGRAKDLSAPLFEGGEVIRMTYK